MTGQPPSRPRSGVPILIGLICLMWVLHAFGTGTALAIRSWDWSTIWKIATAPLAHGSWSHLINNTIGMLMLGGIVAAASRSIFLWVTAASALVSGLGVFLVNSPGTLTLGASGLVFGYAGYLVTAAIWERSLGRKILKALLALSVLTVWGIPLLIGLLPINPLVSWQGHLFGGLGGVLASFYTHRTEPPRRPAR